MNSRDMQEGLAKIYKQLSSCTGFDPSLEAELSHSILFSLFFLDIPHYFWSSGNTAVKGEDNFVEVPSIRSAFSQLCCLSIHAVPVMNCQCWEMIERAFSKTNHLLSSPFDLSLRTRGFPLLS